MVKKKGKSGRTSLKDRYKIKKRVRLPPQKKLVLHVWTENRYDTCLQKPTSVVVDSPEHVRWILVCRATATEDGNV